MRTRGMSREELLTELLCGRHSASRRQSFDPQNVRFGPQNTVRKTALVGIEFRQRSRAITGGEGRARAVEGQHLTGDIGGCDARRRFRSLSELRTS
jgi:hypothetical protein